MIDQKYNLELVLRFFVFKNINISEIKGVHDLGEFLTKKMLAFTEESSFDRKEEEDIFKKTFDLINTAMEENAFKRYDESSDSFKGKFLLSTFEAIAVGLGHNINMWGNEDSYHERLKKRIRNLWSEEKFRQSIGSGMNVTVRIPNIIPLGKEIFKNAEN